MKTKIGTLIIIYSILCYLYPIILVAQTTFNYTGAVQTYTVPACADFILVDVKGAEGESAPAGALGLISPGGKGGRVQAKLRVIPAEVLTIYVGQKAPSDTGGWNGGGLGGINAGGGGGASDIRQGGSTLANRIIVAGGGGGAGYSAVGSSTFRGGNGGGTIGANGWYSSNQTNASIGKGGTQIAGGAGGIATAGDGNSGAIGVGGSGQISNGGGGGAGYYGGGGGASDPRGTDGAGGGGGSSYIIVSATNVTHNQGFQSGNGQVTITPIISTAPLATPESISGKTMVCSGSIETYSVLAVEGASTYNWTLPSGWTGTSTTNTINVTSGSTGGDISVIASNSCHTSAASSMAIIVNPLPPANAGNDVTIYTGESTVLSATGGTSYSWTPATGLSCTNCANPIANPTTTTTYIVTVTDDNTCSKNDTVIVSVIVTQRTFNYTGTSETYTVPTCADSLIVDVRGAEGGTAALGLYVASPGGKGGRVQATIPVTPGEILTINVGERAQPPTEGWNGGGVGGTNAGGGGGASDIRQGGSALTNRIIVAGAGGGGAYNGNNSVLKDYAGGNGGGTTGARGWFQGKQGPEILPGFGGTPTAGGAAGTHVSGNGNSGTLGSGGNGANTNGGGGGAGYYGGGGGGNYSAGVGVNNNTGGGGGGGSSYTIPTASNVIHTQGFQSFNGQIIITPIFSMVHPATPGQISGNSTVCMNTTQTYSVATVAGATKYIWTLPIGWTGSSTTNSITVIASASGGNITVRAANGCFISEANTIEVIVSTALVANAGSDASFCIGGSVNLNATGGTTYSWSPASGLSCTNCQNPVANPSVNTDYIVTVSSGTCAPASDMVKVMVNPLPVANAGVDVTNCSGGSTVLTATGGTSYSWFPTTGLSCTDCSNPTANPTTNTTYIVTVTDGNSCSKEDEVVVTVSAAIVANAGLDVTICAGSSTNLSASGGTSYSWSPVTGLSCTDCSNPVATPSVTTDYTVTVSNGTCLPVSDVVNVLVKPLPDIVIASGLTSICTGSSTTLSASGADSYSWSPTSGLSSTTGASVTANPATTTTYTITGIAANGCIDSTTVTVTVNPLPAAHAGNDVTICSGSSTVLTASGGISYSWSPVTGLSCTNCASPTANPTSTTTYFVNVTDGNSCSKEDTVIVIVTSALVANAGTDASVCPGGSVNLNAGGGTTYSWSPSIGLSCTNCQNPVANPALTTDYTVTVTSGTCAPASDAVTVIVNSLPIANAGSDVTICSGSSTVLTASGGISYSWTPATGLSCTDCANPTANPTTTTTYVVNVIDGNSCSKEDAVKVTVTSALIANAGTDASICEGSSTTLNASGGTTYSWSPATGLNCTNCQNPVANPTITTEYTVTVSSGSCAPASDKSSVMVNALPDANAGNDVTICSGSSTVLTASGGTSYSWTPATGLSCTDCASPTANPTTTTTYLVNVTDGNNCSKEDNTVVTVKICTGITNATWDSDILIFPNPTQDFLNIQFNKAELKQLNLELINIQGQVVYSENVGSISGNYKKQIDISSLAQGIYYLRIKDQRFFTVTKILVQ